MFRRIVYSSLVVGAVSGLLMALMQILAVDPITFAAETYEITDPAAVHDGHNHSHLAPEEGWAPEDGAERTFYTVVSNISAGIGFAAVLLALMSQFWLPKQRGLKPLQGALWGLAGFVAVFLAPGLGLHPEIPGVEAAALEYRQAWWVLTAACVGIGIGILALAQLRYKAIGAVLIAVPYLIGAPKHEGPLFSHPDPAAVDALTQLHQQFIIASGAVNLVFWIVLGIGCALVFNRWLRSQVTPGEQPA